MSNSSRWRPPFAVLDGFSVLIGFGFVGIGVELVVRSSLFAHATLAGIVLWALGVAILVLGADRGR